MYIIYPISTGEFQTAEKSNFVYQKDAGTKIKAPILMYLIMGEDTCMLVDTGSPGEEWAAKYHHPLVQTEEMKPENAIRKFGVGPEDVTDIILTHLHWDHCSNNDKFPNAKIYVQEEELRFAIHPIPTQYTYYESHQIQMTPPWISSMDRFQVIDGDFEVKEGIKLIKTPGHTPGFQSVLVDTENGKYLIASDAIGILEGWYSNKTQGKPTPSGIHINLIDYYKSIDKMLKVSDYVLPGHDSEVTSYEKFPDKKFEAKYRKQETD